MAKETILICCAHDDDAAIGMGGTLIKYLQQRKEVIYVIFSAGQQSHPHLKEKVMANIREKEAKAMMAELGIKKTYFFGLTDSRVKEEIAKRRVRPKIQKVLKQYRPAKIFTLSPQDPHPDHRAVSQAVLEVVEEERMAVPVYAFEVWNLLPENQPVFYEDVTDTFQGKLHLFRHFKSQWLSVYLQLIPVYVRARLYGRKHGCKYAEKFYKIR